MLVERITLNKGGSKEVKVPCHTLIIPDVQFLSLCLEKEDGNLLLWCYKEASELHERIKYRNPNFKTNKNFEFSVPDLWPVAKKFQPIDANMVLELWLTYHGLIQHFIPDAVGVHYSIGEVVAGVKYKGDGWFTKVNTEDSL